MLFEGQIFALFSPFLYLYILGHALSIGADLLLLVTRLWPENLVASQNIIHVYSRGFIWRLNRMFESDINMVIGAIIELYTQMGAAPKLETDAYGPQIVTYCGNGMWRQRGRGYTFNCGVNNHPHIAPPIGDYGHVSKSDGESVAYWFELEYGKFHATRRVDPTKWNYEMKVNSDRYNFNFHLTVR
jgi:hypothetical protein